MIPDPWQGFFWILLYMIAADMAIISMGFEIVGLKKDLEKLSQRLRILEGAEDDRNPRSARPGPK